MILDSYSFAVCPVIISQVKINGDRVFGRTYSEMGATGIKWSGRNTKGDYVRPGMYILKLVLENYSTGEYKKKIIRILVQY